MEFWSRVLFPLCHIRLPASGDVFMNYTPWTNWGWSSIDAGDPEIENEIFTTKALPGKQLGRLNEAMMALIELAENKKLFDDELKTSQAISEFRELAGKIETKKKVLQGTLEGNLENALNRLKQADPKAYDRIIEREYRTIEKTQ